jgi:uncharacterized C2H2 Zn-finger protein
MANVISRCSICDDYFNSKKELKEHKHKNHRITDSRIMMKAPISKGLSIWIGK